MIRFFGPALLLLALSCHRGRYEEFDKYQPTDHLYWQRAYPYQKFDIEGWQNELAQTAIREKHHHARNAGLWETQGPGNLGARINTIAVDPSNHQNILIGYSAGGIYKTENGGQSWKPVFDNFPVMAIGDIVFDSTNPEVVYAGTGDPNISGIPFSGNGIYKSVDGGDTWNYLGLKEAGIIAELAIDPSNPQVLFAASMGIPYYRDANRGLYKSFDGGLTWTKVLFLGDGTGIIDIALHPQDGNIIYAAGWDRIRNYEESITEGEGARIYKSIDGGQNWTLLEGGLPNQKHSRIGIDLATTNPDRLYAVYVGLDYELEQIYTSDDAGESWSTIPISSSSGLGTEPFLGFGWYFGKVRVNPKDENELYLLGVRLWRYRGSTRRWNRVDQFITDEVHADKHDLCFAGEDTLLLGTDGGLYRSVDNASSWLDIEDIPTTQMYRVVYNPHFPDRYYGGAQDNGSSFGNVSTLDQWVQYFDGDGFRTIFHPDDPNLFYVETQLGGLSVTRDGGKTFERATKGIDGSDNINWDAPVIMSHFNPDVLYYGTDRVYRNSSGADENFVAISDKLTDPVVLLDATSNITAMEESPMNDQVLFAGTGDGNLYRTLDLGQKWEKADAGLPDRYITSVVHSSELESVVYVTHSGYKAGEELPHIHRSDDQGGSWTDISGDLPSLPINDVFVLENHNDQVLFAATDGGVYFTLDAGIHWIRLGSNMPIIPVFDLEYNPDQNTLIAGTHAKSIMTFDLTQEGLNGVLGVDTKDQHFNKLAISPNPVEDYLKFELDDFVQDFDLKIFDQGGRIILESKKLHDVLDVSFLNPGVYYLVVHGGNESHLGRFIKL